MGIRVIGVVGKIGSGKDEVLKYLHSRYHIPYLSTGDLVRRIAEYDGIEPTRENLEAISQECFRKLGKGCFVKMVADEIVKKGWKVSGISGIRSPDDVKILRKRFGTDFILLRVDVGDPRLRFERLLLRHEERDSATYEGFLTQDEDEEKVFQISKAGEKADHLLKNDGPLAALHEQIDSLVKAKKLLQVQK